MQRSLYFEFIFSWLQLTWLSSKGNAAALVWQAHAENFLGGGCRTYVKELAV
jgi:hypothetical protein